MTAAEQRLSRSLSKPKSSQRTGVRSEERHSTVDRVEYSVYPRAAQNQRSSVGFTIDRSKSGLGLQTRSAEAVGSTLRVVVRDVADRSTLDALARVVWCAEEGQGRYRIGLEVVAESSRAMRAVRSPEEGARIVRSA